MKSLRRMPLFIAAVMMMASCCNLDHGTVVGKHARKEMEIALLTNSIFRGTQPEIYWVDVQGKACAGKTVVKKIVLFRSDWSRIRVGDHWSREGGFESAPRRGPSYAK